MVSYIEDVELRGMAKASAYRKHIDSHDGNVVNAIRRLENRKEFQAIKDTMTTDADAEAQRIATEVRKNYLNLMNQNLGATASVIKQAQKMDNEEGTAKNTAMAIRLTNETIQATGGIIAPPQGQASQPALDYSGIVK